jgi:DNA-binding response OmpR family regulator
MGQILIIEDEKPLANLLAWMLQQEGNQIMVADNAAEGIELALAEPPDLIITDWMLRYSMHGGEVCRIIRNEYPATKTLIITGYPEIVSQAEAWRDSIDAVIEKPFHMRYLLVAVRQLLRQEEHALTSLLCP